MSRYLSILIPPLAILLYGKPSQLPLSIVLTLAFYVPGLIHAYFVVQLHEETKRREQLKQSLADQPADATAEIDPAKMVFSSPVIRYVGRAPGCLWFLFYRTFLIPKAWRLMSFETDGVLFRLVFGDGRICVTRKGSFVALLGMEKRRQRGVTILTPTDRFKFFESARIYPSEQYDHILQLLDVQKSDAAKFAEVADAFNRGAKMGKRVNKIVSR
jgi:uncharacterized membrane protein YqaE (UPF0057 family)